MQQVLMERNSYSVIYITRDFHLISKQNYFLQILKQEFYLQDF